MSLWDTVLLVTYVAGIASTLWQGFTSDWRQRKPGFGRTYSKLLYGSIPQIVLTALLWPIHFVIGLGIVFFFLGVAIYHRRKARNATRRAYQREV